MRKGLFAISLLVGVIVMSASTPAASVRSADNRPALKSYLLPDLSLKTVISPDVFPVSAKRTSRPATFIAGAARKTGFCRCSCGFPCTSDADCGGTSCDPFITCCDKTSQSKASLFFQGAMNSSRESALPQAVLKGTCK